MRHGPPSRSRERTRSCWSPALAVLALVRRLAGDEAQAAADARAAIEHPDAARRPYGHVAASAALAIIDARAGRRHSARDHTDRALKETRRVGLDGLPAGAPAMLADAVTAALEGRLSGARRAARQAVAAAIAGGVWQAWARSSWPGSSCAAAADWWPRTRSHTPRSCSARPATRARCPRSRPRYERELDAARRAGARGRAAVAGRACGPAAAATPDRARDGRGALPLRQHDQVTHPRDLPQARCPHARGRGRARDRARHARRCRGSGWPAVSSASKSARRRAGRTASPGRTRSRGARRVRAAPRCRRPRR